MNPNGMIYLNGDDDKLVTVEADGSKKLTFFGVENTTGVSAKEIKNLGLKGTRMTVSAGEKEFEVMIPVPGKHMVLNALAAAAIALDLGMTEEEIRAGIAAFQPVGGHGSLVETNKFMILNDCYNANPVSMKAGIDVLSDASGRTAAILGDMFELGAKEAEMHKEVGSYAAQKGIDLIICIGRLARNYYEGAKEAITDGTVLYYADKEEAVKELPKLLTSGDTILVKASHGMHFEKIVAVLEEM
jgi:UDP-N-acetylmuramoyl-tripeptide--D-alanyl-D-alanine ligase